MKLYVSVFTTLLLVLWTGSTDCGIIPSHRAKRGDDPNPQEVALTQLSNTMNQMKADLTALQNKVGAMDRKVAFYVRFHSQYSQAAMNSPFTFDNVILNDGNGYDASLGVFSAPFAGVYVFAVQVFTKGEERPMVDFRLNGNILSRMALDTRRLELADESDSMSIVVQMQAQDKLWVQADGPYNFWGEVHTFFSGAMLYAI